MAVENAPQLQAYRPLAGERISEIVAAFLASPPMKLRKRSVAKYGNALREFRKWTTKTHVSELSRTDINAFMSFMVVSQGLDASTALDKSVIVQAAMNEHGATIKMNKGDWPRSTERERDIYSPDRCLRPPTARSRHYFRLS